MSRPLAEVDVSLTADEARALRRAAEFLCRVVAVTCDCEVSSSAALVTAQQVIVDACTWAGVECETSLIGEAA